VTGEQFSPNFRSTTVAYAYTNVDLSYGVYLSPEWQLGFRQALNYNFIDDGSDVWMATTAPFINYQLRLPTSSFLISALSSARRGTIAT
jgi:hypothetical protein